jgi:putative ABC transport system substrate-binding protein
MSVDRRQFVLSLALAVGAQAYRTAAAQAKVWRVGALFPTSSGPSAFLLKPFVAAVRDLGYVEGKNLLLDVRYADDRYDQLPVLAAELVHAQVDVIVAVGNAATQAAQHATRAVPIVSATMIDPVGSGFAASLARPGGNVTGLANMVADVSGKQVELLATVVPRLSRLVVLMNSRNPVTQHALGAVQSAALVRSIQVAAVDVRTPVELDRSFETVVRERPQGLIVLSDVLFVTRMQRIAQLTLDHHIPSILNIREYARAGGLMSYGQPLSYYSLRTAAYVDKILKGAKPADLPIEQPTKTELVVNRTTFSKLGIAVPQELLLRADEVID